jgi:cytochrome c553
MLRVVLLLLSTTCISSQLLADSVAEGKVKAATCMACHGVEGVSMMDMWPNLAGQKRTYFVKALTDYRDGKRDDPMMTPMAKPLSDADIINLAAYYAQLKPAAD